ncbi:hypothetical protein [Arcobacter cloacae]|uniref:Uncharacterized protein n=1 Tax=Arcobacter cloacae TaxID=1054034 RepID=A0A4Q0ZAX2_9BACT|nr:hypothetical protein [Arcobacter cloacae]RXJ83319.1 hypothetical protein CRU90_10430 [Arcobacter cloacae]
MKITKTLLLLGLLGSNVFAEDSNSAKHFGISALFGFGSELIIHKNFTNLSNFEKISYATIIGSTPGLIKELNDDKFSNEDLAFDIAGALTGALISNYLNNNTSIFISHNKEKEATKVNLAYNF